MGQRMLFVLWLLPLFHPYFAVLFDQSWNNSFSLWSYTMCFFILGRLSLAHLFLLFLCAMNAQFVLLI